MNEADAFRAWRRKQLIQWFLITIVAGPFAIVALLFAPEILWPDDSLSKDNLAKAGTKTLETGVISYRLKYGAYPSKLGDLVNPPDGSPYVEPSAILDQWGRPYQYDPAGPRNQGKKPDIWTTGSDGKPIGNWPEPRHWWDW